MGSSLVSVVDDDPSVRDSTDALLRSAGYQVAVFESGEQFLESARMRETACLVLDIQMAGMDGWELQDRLNVSECGIPIVFISGHPESGIRNRAIERGAHAFLAKPFAPNDFLDAVDGAVKWK
ncbi:MAG TPA: response regulator [Bryobacteraceae bacterium]|nr:response regulator [Bryobacteraceae bacterium]